MAQLKKVVEPFGEVNVYPASGGKVRVVATILMEPRKEGTQTGIALDGSGSMAALYGVDQGGGILSSIFGGKKKTANEITPVAQKVCAYLARKLDADGGTTCIYWATGPAGSRIEPVGDLTADQAEQHYFGPPKDFGTGTQLLPAVQYFVDRFKDAPWGFYVFITDGELHDLDLVKRYSTQLAKDVAAGRRKQLKFVLIGVGPNVNEAQMEELDDLDTGTPIDLWDHKLAAEMRQLSDIFAEVIDKNARVADRAKVFDPQGKVVKDYSDTGMPGYLEFEMPAGAEFFTLEVEGQRIHQGLTDQARVPAAEKVQAAAAPAAPPPPLTAAPAPTTPPSSEFAPKPAAAPPLAAPPKPAAPPPVPPRQEPAREPSAEELSEKRELWQDIDLRPPKEDE